MTGPNGRLRDCLSRLLQHVAVDEIALTGGVAIDLHLRAAGAASERAAIADADFVARSVDAVRPSVVGDFLVSHYHLPQPGYPKFMVQLVDPIARIRIDIFPDRADAVARADLMAVAGHSLRVLAASAILDHKLQCLATASPTRRWDPKHQRDAISLAALCGRRFTPLPDACFAKDLYDAGVVDCARCAATPNPAFPLAPKPTLVTLLGYA